LEPTDLSCSTSMVRPFIQIDWATIKQLEWDYSGARNATR
jgi:hypothetical protein